MSDEVLQKNVLRETCLAKRQAMPVPLRRAHGQAAQRALLASDVWANARRVALYMPVRAEIDTSLLLEDAWARGIQVLLPRCVPHVPGQMDFLFCAERDCLRAGLWGILEPGPQCPALPWDGSEGSPDVVVIPALAYDVRGYRLGYGGGYYDRALSQPAFAASHSVGLCYAALCLPQVPTESWDQPVKALCTEEGLRWL